MIEVTDEQFRQLIAQAMDAVPEHYARHIDNVAIVWETEPTETQRQKLQLRGNSTLFGLYEGIPLTKRTGNYSMVLPDKITLFKNPILHVSLTLDDVRQQIAKTLWHEVAHHFGLDHDRIHDLENKDS